MPQRKRNISSGHTEDYTELIYEYKTIKDYYIPLKMNVNKRGGSIPRCFVTKLLQGI